MPNNQSHWEQIYQQVPLIGVPQHHAGMRQPPFAMQYLQAILERCRAAEERWRPALAADMGLCSYRCVV
jgi:hypothetical protein